MPPPPSPSEQPDVGPTARRRTISLRAVLQLLAAGLLLTVVLVLAAIRFRSDRQIIASLEREIVRVAARDIGNRVSRLLDAGERTAQDLDIRATYGRLPLDDEEALATFLGDRLRYELRLSRLLYGDAATGKTVAAVRQPGGRILAMISASATGAGESVCWYLGEDGSRSPYDGQTPRDIDARDRPWFQAAARGDGIRWVGPYRNILGIPSLAVAAPVHDLTTGSLRGVWSAEFDLDSLPTLLRDAADARPDVRLLLLDRTGQVVATSSDTSPALVAASVAELPRPLADLPLEEPRQIRFTADGRAWVGIAERFQAGGDLDWIVTHFLPERSLLQPVYDNQKITAGVSLCVLALGLLLGTLVARRIARSLRSITDDLGAIARFEFSSAATPTPMIEELAVIADATDRMKASLRSFARYVPTAVVRELLASGQEARLGGEMRVLSLHFSDIEGFTTCSERLPPGQIVEYLAEYLELMTKAIRDEGGIVDQVLGDGILALFNAPTLLPGHAAANCRAALAAQRALVDLRARWEPLGRPLWRTRIGLHTGEVMVGNFGTHEHIAYGVIGDAVNLSSRLEGLNKSYGSSIMVSEDLRAAAGPGFEWRLLDRVAVVGRSGGTLVSELLGEAGSLTGERLAARDAYEAALATYFSGRFAEAAAGFRRLADAQPADRAATVLAERAEAFARHPPASWSGIHVATGK